MPAFTLYGFEGTTNTDRVLLTLAESGFTDYAFVPVNLRKGEHKTKEYIQRHPWGKVPLTTFPDGYTLYESRAICKYLARRFSFPLLPADSDLEATALFEQAQSAETLYFAKPASRITFEKFAKSFRGLSPDEAVVSEALRSLEAFFDVADGLLRQNDYMAGDEFTLVDIYYIPEVLALFAYGYGDVIVNREAVNAWWNRCVNRPGIQQRLAADKQQPALVADKAEVIR